jgi:hypothetical protein
MRNPWSKRGRLTFTALVLALATSSLPVHAQDENVAAARSLGIQGVRLAEEGKCKEAIEKLERAEALYHAPTILGRLGECQVQVGLIVKGTENLNKVVREQLPANAPKAFVDAQARARGVLDQALPRIAYLTVNVGPANAQADVTVGGTAVPRALIGAERPTDPGTHEVVASAQGFLPSKATVKLAEGKHETITLNLQADPNAAAAPAPGTPPGGEPQPGAAPAPGAPPPAPGSSPPPQADSGGGGGKTLGWVLIGVGGVGLAVGGITGGMAMGQAGDLKDKCNDEQSGNCEQSDIDDTKSLAMISNVGFGVGAAAALVGIIVLATSGGSENSARRERTISPYIGLDNAGLTGSF